MSSEFYNILLSSIIYYAFTSYNSAATVAFYTNIPSSFKFCSSILTFISTISTAAFPAIAVVAAKSTPIKATVAQIAVIQESVAKPFRSSCTTQSFIISSTLSAKVSVVDRMA
ncbi:Hypothetical_protein [Hexamita inflata]|uniref:Hypothetical_protein n=1 Tax=Hexamita inflata TaxID=28002 RepID=A0AA86NKZ8_9EUKA|nr:Hypothetical protein HINF_LOCUS9747 [Hexamita inflata]